VAPSQPAQDQNRIEPRPPRFREKLMGQFREVVKHLVRRSPAPQPTARRRRGEDTSRAAFRQAAKQIMRRAARLPAAAYQAVEFLSHTLDWLNPWHHQAPDPGELEGEFGTTEQNHLSPHP